MRWPIVPLTDAYWFQEGPGVRTWQFTDHGIKLLNVTNILKSGVLDLNKTNRHLSEDEVGRKYSHFLIDAGDLVIASSGISIEDDGLLRTRAALVSDHHLPLCMNTSTIRFKAITEVACLPFLKHWIDSPDFRLQITKEVTGIAQKNFGPSHLKRLQIPLPPLPEQKRIAAILDAADALRAKRRESIEQLESLVQATFLKMFGDPVTNPKGWNISLFGSLGECRLGKMLDKGKKKGGIELPYLANKNVQWNHIDIKDLRMMEFTADEQVEFALQDGDLLICEGGDVGRSAIWHGPSEGIYFQKALHRMRASRSIAAPEYLLYFMWSMARQGGFNDFTNSATIAHLTGVQLKKLPCPVPPLKLQTRFASIVESIEHQKTRLKSHLAELDALFSSLQSRAFNGELVA